MAVQLPPEDPEAVKPLVVMMAIPTYGHTLPMLKICSHLTRRGYQVFFIGGVEHEAQIRRAGADFFAHPPWGITEAFKQERDKITDTIRRNTFEAVHVYIESIPQRHGVLRSTLEYVRRAHDPERKRAVVIVHECISAFATLPFFYGAPLPEGYDRLPKVINMPIYALFLWSVDTPFFGPGGPPTTTALGRWTNRVFLAVFRRLRLYQDALGRMNEVMASVGMTSRVTGWLPDVVTLTSDVTLMVCSPSMEYPRSDLSHKLRYIGCLPNNAESTSFRPRFDPPAWWPEIEANAAASSSGPDRPGRKRIVMVTQGTLSVDYADLVLPSLEALAGRDDVLVVAVLGGKGKTLGGPRCVHDVPSNARVADYLPYEAILPLADVSVQNGGYGGWTQAVMYGVPTVLAGGTEEKKETIMRGVWAGTSVGIKKRRPAVRELRDAVDAILADYSRYRNRVMELRAENERLDAMGQVERFIIEDTPRLAWEEEEGPSSEALSASNYEKADMTLWGSMVGLTVLGGLGYATCRWMLMPYLLKYSGRTL